MIVNERFITEPIGNLSINPPYTPITEIVPPLRQHMMASQEQNQKTNFDLWALPLSGDQKPFPYLQTDFAEQQGRFSPDGKWVAYASNESGTWQVYVQSFPASGGKWQVSTNGGAQPQWRRDGKELFYLSPDRKLMTVDVKGHDTFDAGAPKELFGLRLQTGGVPGPRNYYVASADDQRFLVA